MKYHEPKLVVDDNVEGVIVKCSECGKILWFPEMDEECEPAPPLGVYVKETIKMSEYVR